METLSDPDRSPRRMRTTDEDIQRAARHTARHLDAILLSLPEDDPSFTDATTLRQWNQRRARREARGLTTRKEDVERGDPATVEAATVELGRSKPSPRIHADCGGTLREYWTATDWTVNSRRASEPPHSNGRPLLCAECSECGRRASEWVTT